MRTTRGLAFVLLGCVASVGAATACLSSFDGLSGGDDAGVSDGPGDVAEAATDGGANEDAGADGGGSLDDAGGDAGLDVEALVACTNPDLVAYWPCDEGIGTTVRDCHGVLDGTFNGQVSWSKRGDAGSLDIHDGFVDMGKLPDFVVPGAFTVVGWFRTDKVPDGFVALLWNFDAAFASGYEIAMSPTGDVYGQVGIGDGGTIKTIFPPLSLGAWTHLASVYTPGYGLEVYKDGQSVARSVKTEDGGTVGNYDVAPNDKHLRFGNVAATTWSGGVSEVRIFRRALGADEIAALATR